jgi:alcohol dehydrogenase
MLPVYYEFFSPVKIISGNKALDNLPYELDQLGVQHPFIITDVGVIRAGLIHYVKAAFAGSGMTIGAIFDDVPSDSSTDVVHQAVEIFRKNKCDSLVAVGGGSPIDTAKAANIILSENSDDLKKLEGSDRLKAPMNPLIVVPTTAGTGSEVTFVAVIKDKKKEIKMSFASHLLFPKVAIIDPRMTQTLPPFITAATGMDALTHAMEAYTCIQKNPISDAFAFAAVQMIGKNLIKVVSDVKNVEARMAMANASTMAGIAFSNSMVGMVHSLGHAAGAFCNLPHGVVMSIFLPFGLEYNLNKTRTFVSQLLLPLGGQEEFVNTNKTKRAEKTIILVRKIRQTLYEICGLPRSLKEAGVSKTMLEPIAQRAINDGSLIFNPEELDYNDALAVLNKAYEIVP